MNLKNKIALITGGTQGIGAQTAIQLSRQGVCVSVVARNTSNSKIVNEININGGNCIAIDADMSNPEDCKRAVAETVAKLGGLDILVHCAGTTAHGSLLNGAKDVWYKAFDVHVHAAFHLCMEAVPYMKERGEGAVILISSAAGLRGVKGALAYAVVKGAIPQFVRTLAYEVADANIRVNCVSPGVIRTRFQDYLTQEQVKNNVENRIPLHREGSPQDVAETICMLVKNDFITGENVVVDGGMTMRVC